MMLSSCFLQLKIHLGEKGKPTHSYQTSPHRSRLCGFYSTLLTWSLNRNHDVCPCGPSLAGTASPHPRQEGGNPATKPAAQAGTCSLMQVSLFQLVQFLPLRSLSSPASLLRNTPERVFSPNVTPTSGLGQGPHFIDVGLAVGLVHLHHDEMLVGHGLRVALVRWRGCRVGWGRRRGQGRGALKPTGCRTLRGWALQPCWGLDPWEGTDGVLADQGELGIHLPPGAVQGWGNGSIDSAWGRLLGGRGSSGGHADCVLLGVARTGRGVSGGHKEEA